MLKSSVLGSLLLVPLWMVGCGSDGLVVDSSAGSGGTPSAGANSAGTSGAHLNGGSGGAGAASGTAGAPLGEAGDNSAAGEAGSADAAGASGETGGAGGAHGGAGGASGHAGLGGSSGAAGNAGHGGAAGNAGASGNAGAGGGATCTTSAQCAGSQVCIATVCTPCDSVTFSAGSTVYFVDPANGSDSNGTGSAKSGGQAQNACAFKTIARALQVIGSPTQASGATVKLKGNAGTATGESCAISIPHYVVIQGANSPVTVKNSTGKVGVKIACTRST
ncbi:MAG: hypothetical protein ABW061_07330, partial [Polyangiaceae bacterium]